MKKDKIKWASKDFDITTIYNNYRNGDWRIPSYQRGYVWKEEQVVKLVDSIISGFPIGSILLWKNDKGKSFILDGQQRTISLLKVRNKPFKYLSSETFSKLIGTEKYELATQEIINKLADFTIDEIVDMKGNFKKPIEEIIDPFLANIDGSVKEKLNEYVMIWKYDKSKIVTAIEVDSMNAMQAIELFKRINTSGKKLNDYEVLAARWSETKIEDRSGKLIENSKHLYKSFYDGIGIDSSKIKEFSEKEITPSEFFYTMFYSAFKNTSFFRELFISTSDDGTTEIIDSKELNQLLWIIRYILYKRKEDDSYILKNKPTDPYLGWALKNSFTPTELGRLAKAIIDSTKKFEKYVKVLMIKNSNDKFVYLTSNKGRNLPILALAQIIWREFNENPLSKKEWKDMSINVLADWFNSAFRSATTSRIKKVLTEDAYLVERDYSYLESVIEALEKNQRNEMDSRGFEPIAKYIVSIAYYDIQKLSVDDFDYDHVIPYSILKKNKFVRGKGSIGNASLLNRNINNSKSDTFDPEVYAHDRIVEVTKDINKKEYKEKLRNVIDENYSRAAVEELYDYRFEIIKGLFIKSIKGIY